MSHHYLRFDQVHFRYPGGYEALHAVSFTLRHGEKVALLGNNGAGKSTLLLHCNGLLMPTQGQVDVGGVPVSKRTLPLVRRSVGLLFQNPDDQLFMPTVEEDVAFGPRNMGLPPEEVERRVAEALAAVGMTELRQRAPFRLSGGQKRCVALATVLSMGPDVLVMDEPTSNLDLRARRRVVELVQSFSHTCLIATHDLDLARQLCPRTLLLSGGTLCADGPTASVLADKALLRQADFLL